MPARAGVLLAFATVALATALPASADVPDTHLFFDAASTDENTAEGALARIAAAGWRDNYAALIVDVARFLPRPRPRAVEGSPATQDGAADDAERSGALPLMGSSAFPEAGGLVSSPRVRARERLIRFLEQRTGQRFGQDLKRWRRWIWALPDEPHPQYARFKASLYSAVDPAFAEFFPPGVQALIRLDEVDWGGVAPNGIPALDHPATVPARDAAYMKDGNVVFGVFVNGEARAYPKRILAWHELARDRVGGVELTVVYCTLCGTVVPYASEVGGRRLTFATSGLLYRANKLMFDAETRSLWSAIEGRPVIGPLAGSGLELRAHPVVTTTWREWSAVHPDGTVLSLATGHDRDYSEGAAYREYFSHDRLMFEVPEPDDRLKNKAEVLALLLRPAGAAPGTPRRALAVATHFLKQRPVYSLSFAGHDLVVLTSADGAHRVYAGGSVQVI